MTTTASHPSRFRWPLAVALALGCGIALLARADRAGPAAAPEPASDKAPLGMTRLGGFEPIGLFDDKKDDKDKDKDKEKKKIPAPEIDGGIAWLNTSIVPSAGGSMPSIRRIVVVLPEPLGPRKP